MKFSPNKNRIDSLSFFFFFVNLGVCVHNEAQTVLTEHTVLPSDHVFKTSVGSSSYHPWEVVRLCFPTFSTQGKSKVQKRVAQLYSASELRSEKRKSSVLKPHHPPWLVSGISLDPHSRLPGFTLGRLRRWRTERSNESTMAFQLEAASVVSLEVSDGALNPQHLSRVCSVYEK